MRFAVEEFLHRFLHGGHAGHTADEDDFVNVGCRLAGVFQGFLARFDSALDEVFDKAFELGAGQLDVEVFRAGGVGRDEGQVHFVLVGRRQFLFRLLGFFLEALQGELVSLEVDALVFLELGCEEVDDAKVEVFTPEERVAIGRQDFEHAVTDFE